jgi:hypothetical protein
MGEIANLTTDDDITTANEILDKLTFFDVLFPLPFGNKSSKLSHLGKVRRSALDRGRFQAHMTASSVRVPRARDRACVNLPLLWRGFGPS